MSFRLQDYSGIGLQLVIEVSRLVKNFGQVQALRGLDLEVARGVFGFVGPNGAGKTTTVKILLGLMRASGGQAKVLGLDVWKESFAIRKRVGVLHEKPRFPGWVTGLEYLEYVCRLKGLKEPRRTALEELEFFGLSEAVERKIGGYSAGMVQRLGLAQAFVGEPELVFLDEPTANLDPLGRAEFLEMVRRRCKGGGVSVVISTHILSELERVCDSVAILFGGVVLERGLLSDLVEKYSEGVYVVESTNNERLVVEFERLECVEGVWVEGAVIKVKVKDRDEFEKGVVGLVHGLGFGLRRFEPVLSGLEDVYKKVLGEQDVE